jgi:hypothetical protein
VLRLQTGDYMAINRALVYFVFNVSGQALAVHHYSFMDFETFRPCLSLKMDAPTEFLSVWTILRKRDS